MHDVAARPNKQWSLKVDFFCQNGFESYKFTQEKRWLTYAVLGVAWNITHCSILSIVMTSPIEFSTDEFSAKQVWKSFKMA